MLCKLDDEHCVLQTHSLSNDKKAVHELQNEFEALFFIASINGGGEDVD